ncbi:MAG TPA: DUF1858 domain-containing protein, partial [Bacteroidetes bacterium]|nr:DUF1858 domain-containing protein [Bacteroidota bacterium]
MITAQTNVKQALEEHPELKDVLIGLSGRLKKLNNPLVFKTVAKWATFADVARISGLSICQILHALNKALGTEQELYRKFPECIEEKEVGQAKTTEKPSWLAKIRRFYEVDVRDREDFFLPDLTQRLEALGADEALVVVNEFDPIPLKKMAEELGFEAFTEVVNPYEVRVTFYRVRQPEKREEDWRAHKEDFPVLDVRFEKTDPFEKIIKIAYRVPEGKGFA